MAKKKIKSWDGKVYQCPESEFCEFLPLYYNHVRLMLGKEPSVRMEILNAISVYAYCGVKLRVSEEAEDVFDVMVATVKSSRTHAKNARGRRDKTVSQDAPNIDTETGEVHEEREQSKPTATVVNPAPTIPKQTQITPSPATTPKEREKYFDGSVYRFKDTHEIAPESDLPF